MGCCGGRQNTIYTVKHPQTPVYKPTIRPIPVRRRTAVRSARNNPIDKNRDQ